MEQKNLMEKKNTSIEHNYTSMEQRNTSMEHKNTSMEQRNTSMEQKTHQWNTETHQWNRETYQCNTKLINNGMQKQKWNREILIKKNLNKTEKHINGTHRKPSLQHINQWNPATPIQSKTPVESKDSNRIQNLNAKRI